MSYNVWFKNHGEKHRAIIDKLVATGYTKDQIIDYFDFENMVNVEPDFCILYSEHKKCHDVQHLNCFLCACPLFRFNSNGIHEKNGSKIYSYCHVNSKYGVQGLFEDSIHQDCSGCTIPHNRKYVSRNFDLNWFAAMKNCNLECKDRENR